MVFVHPSLPKNTVTTSAEAFRDERIARLGRSGQRYIFSAQAFYYNFSIFNLGKSHFIKHRRKYNQRRAIVPEIVSSGTYNLCRKASILFFWSNCIFHLNIRTRQVCNQNKITGKSVARSDGVTSSHTCPLVKVS